MSHLESIIPPLFKKTLGQWASGVTVITTFREGTPHGITASSFSSLSLESPLVLVSVDQRARLHQLLPETGRYGVSILAKGQDLLSTHFAGRPSNSLQIPWIEAEGLPFLGGAATYLRPFPEVTTSSMSGASPMLKPGLTASHYCITAGNIALSGSFKGQLNNCVSTQISELSDRR